MLQALHKLHSKFKTISELTKALHKNKATSEFRKRRNAFPVSELSDLSAKKYDKKPSCR